jgi:thiol-disulfide isomerase/thioredoxin
MAGRGDRSLTAERQRFRLQLRTLPDVGTRDLTEAIFKPTVDANDNVLVYFWAPNCAPCDLLTPTYEASSNKNFDVVHGKVNFEAEKHLAKVAQVTLLPTLMAFKKGKLVFKQAGIANPTVMDDLVRHLRAYKVKDEPAAGQRRLI